MGRIFFFFLGFILSFLKMLVGSVVICGIIGFFFPPALYVLVPLFLLASVFEATKDGIERSGDYAFDKNQRKQRRKDQKRIKKLRKTFNENELYEFDNAWKQLGN